MAIVHILLVEQVVGLHIYRIGVGIPGKSCVYEVVGVVWLHLACVCGVIARPNTKNIFYDEINLAAKGWQMEQKLKQEKLRKERK